jgi:hypothetical protein
MSTRTVKILGWGTGTASLIATLDGETVFLGDVNLIEFTNDTSGEKMSPTLFTFELPIDFTGTKQIKITVAGAPVRFGQIVANYTRVEWGEIYYTGPYDFADIGVPDSQGSRDPRNTVYIDGVLQPVDRHGMMGTWHWNIEPGSTFEHALHIPVGSNLEF